MNIWLVNQYAIPPTQSGGTRHYSIAKNLMAKGHQVTIVASSFDHVSRRETRLRAGQSMSLEMVAGVPFLWLRTPPYEGNTMARVKNMLVFAKRVCSRDLLGTLGRPDVVVGSSPHLFGAWGARRQAASQNAAFVLEVRDLWPESLVQIGGYSRRHPMVLALAALERSLYRSAAQIWTLLPSSMEHIAARGGDFSRIKSFPNGVDLDLVPPVEPPPEGGPMDFMYAGTVGMAQRLDHLLDVAKHCSQTLPLGSCRFRILGDGPEKPRLMARAESEKIGNIVFEAPVAKTEVYKKLSTAHVLVAMLPDLALFQQHGTSMNKLQDYMAAARPVLFSVRSSNDPVRESGAGISVLPNDVGGMVEAVRTFVHMSSAARWEMGLRGRRHVEKSHSFSSLAERMERELAGLSNHKASN